jgi:hypothetical protein
MPMLMLKEVRENNDGRTAASTKSHECQGSEPEVAEQ